MRGSVIKILRQFGCGFVLTDDGNEVVFGRDALDGIGIDDLEEGESVEVELYDFGGTVKHIRREGSRRSEHFRRA